MPRAYHLVDVLRERVRQPGQAPAYTFLEDGEAEGGSLSWSELDRTARAIAVHLAEVARPGERALLLFPAGLDFIAAFFGCLYAGVVAVPSYPPRPNRGQQRLRAIVRDAAPAVVLAQKALLPRAASLAEDVPELAAARWLATDDLGGAEDLTRAAEVWRAPAIRPDDLAFLQYTSGSTSLPKGVRVSHANLIANERMIAAAFRQTEESVVVGWLPLYHDMGLIGNVLQPLWSGGRCVLMSPVAFLQKPLRWLAAISRYRATTSDGPNFAYDLCARKIAPEDRAGLDLSSWRVAYNGAEPVRPSTLDRFAAAFAECGFSPAALYPCYGLAEATLFVSGGTPGAGARATRFDAEELRHGRAVVADELSQQALVACGGSWLEQRLAIVDPESREELPEGRVGEIWIAGPNVGGGYWGRPEASAETFAATTAAGAGPYLRTGDLGFRHGVELFVAGRIKDLIILRGRNLYPQDLEETAERAHPALRAGNGAAFSVADLGTDGEEAERLVLVYEVDRRAGPEVHEEIAVAVRAAIAEEHEAQVAELVLVKIGGVPKTSSGKVQRHACREGYLAGTLPVVARSAAAFVGDDEGTETTDLGRDELTALPAAARRRALEAMIAGWAARALGVAAARIERDAPLSGYGLDSLAALELRSAVEERLGVALPLATLFEGATLGDLATLIGADLETAATKPLAAIPETAREPETGETFPLSYGQEGLWVVERLAPDSGAYNLAAAFRVDGGAPEWPERLANALSEIVARHTALRLRLIVADGAPRQRVAAPDRQSDLDFAVEDLAGRSIEEALADLADAAYRPFDLAHGPLVRVRVLRGPAHHLLLFAAHHSVTDFASFGTIARDLATILGGGNLAPLAQESGYAEWVRWQRDLLAGPAGERLRAFWRERLGSGVPDLDLPTDRPRPTAQSFGGTVAGGALPRDVAARLEALARQGGATLQAALLAGFAAELSRTSGQEGFALGVPTAGRSRSRFAETVGYFVNPVAVRARTAGDPSFRDLLERTRDELLGALEHADDPFPLLAAELVPARDAARPPLFQAMLVHHAARGAADAEGAALAAVALGAAGGRLDLVGQVLVSLELPERRAQFDLTLRSALNASAGTLALALEANADLFDRTTAARLLDRFARLLAAAAAAPETALSALPRLSPAERHQLRLEWNDRGAQGAQTVPELSDLCLHELFFAQAARTPNAEALIAGAERLSYRDLRNRVSWLADALVARGAGPEIRVAVCLNRSVDLVAALLAVLQSGSAYVPLDPTYPRERLALMLADSGARLLITEESCLAALPGDLSELGLETLRVDLPIHSQSVSTHLARRVLPDNLAYLIYTSGSTGRPKAVAIEHRAAVALALWARRELSDAELSGVAAVTSVCFDLSVFELFVPLAWGGRTILAENALALPAHPARAEISLINTVPSAMAELAGLDAAFPALRAVILAGEPLPGELVERIYRMPEQERALTELTVRNLYGPSEDTTYSTGAAIPRGEARPSIGRPIDGGRAYLLDRAGRTVPRGVPGELFLGGAGLARGYLDRPDTTAERFVPDPFATAGQGGARLYRTGDLARYRADSELDFLGRIDNQVKIRGFRIELGEIEAALLAHPHVAECVVVAADGKLIAYVAGDAEDAPDPSALAAFLATTLPSYMVPAAFVVLPALPRSANGKVDRKALPAPSFLGPAAEGVERQPADDIEQLLAGLFAEVLGVARVGLDDDFFSVGGHSLAAMRLLARVCRAFEVDLPARALFEAPTVAHLAAKVRAARATARDLAAAALPIERLTDEERGGPLPTSFAQRRIWFLERLDPGRATYHLPGRLALTGALDVEALRSALRAVVERHEALRTGFEARLEGPVQIVAPAVRLPLPAVDLAALGRSAKRAEADRASARAARQPFDLARPPLLRALLLAMGGDRHELILNLHHLVSDGWSLGILADEIGAAYSGSSLPTLPVQVVDAASWERRRLAEGYLGEEERYWAEALAEPPPPLDLPFDFQDRLAVESARGARLQRELGCGAAALDAVARRLGATPFMIVAAAWGVALGRFGASEDLLLGTPISVRTSPELELLIGCFVNTLALRIDLFGDPSFAEQVERLRAVSLEAYARRHLPYDRLVELLRPTGSGLAGAPFQAFLVLEDPLPAPRMPGLETRLEPIETGTAKFDLTLALERRPDGTLSTTLEYASDRFEPNTAERILSGFARLFESSLGAPERRLGELPLLSEEENAQLIAWGTGPAGSQLSVSFVPQRLAAAEGARRSEEANEIESVAMSLDDLVARWERETPEALAVADPSGEISYARLGARANRLAWRMRALGVAEDARVAICIERSIDLIVAELAVLRAGGAYAPIDPAYPEERRADMVALAGARVVIVRSELAGAWCGADRGVEILTLDLTEDSVGASEVDRPVVPPPVFRDPERLAYAIFTSGSSGRPKGVAMSHRGALHIVSWHLSRYSWTPADRGAQVAAPSFDAAVIEIWPALASGASLHVPPAEVRLAAPAQLDWFVRERVTIAWVPTVIAEGIVALAPPPGLSLRYLTTGGDRLHRGVAPDSPFGLCNEYGPAENAVITTESVPVGAETPSIGRPIDDVRVYILDRRLDRAPAGTPGELVASGVGLARGYLGDPAQTAERFVPDPFAAEPGSRMYRSGDRARFRRNIRTERAGEIDFLGRIDAQVKIRGQRVELLEIEAALVALPAVREAAVGVREGLGGETDRRLVAYLVPAAAPAGSAGDAELIEALSRRLSDAMVPHVYLRLDALPMTANGKVDARALAALALPAPVAGGLAPRNAAEARLAAIWAEALGLPEVGVEDDFFALGGHSLLAAKLAYRLQEELGVEVPVATLYGAPTVARLARRLDASRLGRIELPIPLVARGPALPLSVAQERIWFLEELEGPSALHHIAAAFTGAGRLDVAAFRLALSGVWARHEALRARFAVVDGKPSQSFAPVGEDAPALPEIDLSGLAKAREVQSAAAARASALLARRPFDLARGPLLRAALLRLDEACFRLALVVHHLVADGVSLGILEGELSELYAAAIERRPAVLEALPCQYADFAAWQRDRLASAADAAEIETWRAELEGLPPLLLPADRELAAGTSHSRHRGRTVALDEHLGAGIGAAIERLSRAGGTTPFVAFLAGYAAALARWAGQEEFGLGVPEAGRPRREAERLVGLFVNTVVVRVDATGDPTGYEFLDRLRGRLAGALAHAATPFERLVEALAPERDRERTPWFQAMAAARPAGEARLELPGVELRAAPLDTGTAKFDLTLMADAVAGNTWRGAVEYDAGRFDAATVERWIGQLERLLADLAERPAARLSELRLLSERETTQLLVAARGPALEPEPEISGLLLDDLVARWERETPQALAVAETAGSGRTASYAELGARANALAWRLRKLGATEDTVVALCLDRSIDLIVAELGTLRAGAAYAPIDPAYPPERRAAMVAAAGAVAVVTLSSLFGSWAGALPAILLDRPAESNETKSNPPAVRRDPERLAYAIFTSGSSGRPKCVAMSHLGALHVVAWHRERFGWTTKDRGTQVSGPSFDAAVIEIWPALASGASLHVPGADVRLSAPDLLAWLARERLTIAWAPTALVELMAAEPLPEGLALRFLQTGGDRLLRGVPEGAAYVLCNQYGPAENAVITTQGESAGEPVPSIGRPISEVRAYLLDRRLNLAPPGTPGEIVAAGGGLACGYRNDPGQTAERFVPDPFGARPGARMYLTGDRARLKPDGSLEFLGRLDGQVKIRGQRIELGEIEAALSVLPGVREAAVVAHEEMTRGRLERRLVAYLVADAEVADRELISALSARLADAMVPRVFVRLEELPLTANGKVDRRALARRPAPVPAAIEVAEETAPSSDLERRIAAACRDLLGLARMGREDDFFAHGGHSLLAAQLIYRLRGELGMDLPVGLLFDEPTPAGLARRIAALEDAAGAEADEAPPIGRADRSAPLPLSFAQERLWFIEQLEGPSALYHIPAAFSATGALDLPALATALDGIWSRHEALRARIVDSDQGPVQSFAPTGRAPRFLVDVKFAAEARRVAEAEARRPFDLARGPLLRSLAIRRGARRFDLVLVLHHLAADGVSLAVIERELSALYARALGKPAPALAPLALHQGDVAVWQRGRETAERLAPRLAAQVAELSADDGAAIEPLELATDRPRPAVSRHRGANLALAPCLAPETGAGEIEAALGRLAERFGVTAFQAWFAAFGALLARESGRELLAIGLPVAGRTVETEGIVGLFADTRVARAGLVGDPSVADLLAASRARLVATEAQGDVPFEKLVEALAPARARSTAPLFQVALVSRPTTGRGLVLPGVRLQPIELGVGTAKWDLTLYVEPEARGGASAGIEYDADLFDEATIRRRLDRLGRLLVDMGERPTARRSELQLLSAAERAELIAAAAGPERSAAPEAATCLDDLVARWETATPEALAVADPAGRVTYGELGARANRLAWRLRELGIAEESRVAVCLDRSVDLIVAELAALRAGAAYAPIDPAYPPERRGDMVALAGATVVVTRSDLAGAWCGAAKVLALDAEPALRSTQAIEAPPRRKDPEGLAYAIFTSGSMGRPKGVAMSHRGALHIVSWHLERFGWTPSDRGSQVSGPSFDAAVIEIWPALAAGASLHVPPADVRLSAPDLLAWFARERLTVAWSPTPLVELFAGEPQPAGLLLRFLQTGGDRLLHGAPAGAPYVLCNQYGPAESAVITTQGESAAAGGRAGAVPSIGRPISGVRTYVLDRWQGLAPRGSGGELGVAGEGLARGYFDDPVQTAERFVPDPFSGETGGRMYRTGDRARQRPDGTLDFLGRIDRQIKIRGQRIELGEIEAALSALSGVREAAVLVDEEIREGGGVERRLVAFLVVEPGAGHADRELVEALRRRLAEAMVPKSFVHLAALPLTANGKVDRRALARLAAEASASDAAVLGEGPRGEIEGEVAAIWADLLGGRRIGRDDSFFDLGGHSLLATRAAQRLRQSFGIELPLAVLFDQPTLAGLAHWIAGAVAAGAPSADAGFARPIPRADRGRPLPLSFAQERLWLLDRFEPESSTYTIPAAIALSGDLAPAALSAAVFGLAQRHESLRTTFALAGDAPVQRIAERGNLSLPLADLSALPAARRAAERERLYERLAALPFDLSHGPLARFLLIELAPAEHALLMALHHAIADGWSFGVLVRDLAALYGAAVAGKPAALPDLAIQVADHAAWQRGELTAESLALRLAHWREVLQGAPPALELPLDRPRPALRTFTGAAATLVLAPDLADGVRRLARSGSATLFMTLLAAWAHLLGRLAGQDDVAIGTPVAERDRPELEPLIGMFLNTLVLRLDLAGAEGAGAPSFRDLIGRSRGRVLDAFAHEVPFERLLDEINPVRDLSRTPLFQAFFNMVNLPEVRLAVEGLDIAPLAAPEASAKFDLTVYAAEEGREIRLEWVYNSDLFDPARIAAMLDQYRELLAQAVAAPDRPAAELSLVAGALAAGVLPDPRTPLSSAWEGSVPARFAAWAERAPERLAVADPAESFTYGELLVRMRRLAQRLGRDGVGKGDVVAILGHRSARLVPAVMGVLEAGAAFTILDPAHPAARLVDTLRLARPRGFLALEAAGPVPAEIDSFLDELNVACRLRLPAAGSSSDDPTADEPEIPSGVEIGPDDLAYLSFTSGSTGVPKGILGRHGPLSHFVPWQQGRFGFGPGDRYTMLSGLAHDPLQRDLFTPLQTGAAVVAPVPGDIAVPGRLAAWMRDERITVAHLTPAMGQILCEPAPGQPAPTLPDLAWAFFVGDVLTRRDVARLVALAPNVRVVNYYGSTETQRSVGYHCVAPTEATERGEPAIRVAKQSLPLGRGIEDVQLLVVNRAGRLAGIGEVDEILMRSPHLAAGYVGDREGTAARFTANLLGDDRVYRTGDLGRYLPDGEVEFSGRADVQVKIRGFRIEPGEIEALLGRHSAVRDCVVVARARPDGEKRLIAYVVLERSATAADLRGFLKVRLPDYMVPAVFAILEKLPVNPNGKVDRAALPAAIEEARSGAFAAPQTEIERTLAAILREVLGVERVGKDDNFFELGGNSLQMVKVHARVQETFGTDLQVVQLFTNPTVAALAAFLSQGEAAPRSAAVVEDRSEKLATGRDRLKRRLVQRKAEEEQE